MSESFNVTDCDIKGLSLRIENGRTRIRINDLGELRNLGFALWAKCFGLKALDDSVILSDSALDGTSNHKGTKELAPNSDDSMVLSPPRVVEQPDLSKVSLPSFPFASV